MQVYKAVKRTCPPVRNGYLCAVCGPAAGEAWGAALVKAGGRGARGCARRLLLESRGRRSAKPWRRCHCDGSPLLPHCHLQFETEEFEPHVGFRLLCRTKLSIMILVERLAAVQIQ